MRGMFVFHCMNPRSKTHAGQVLSSASDIAGTQHETRLWTPVSLADEAVLDTIITPDRSKERLYDSSSTRYFIVRNSYLFFY